MKVELPIKYGTVLEALLYLAARRGVRTLRARARVKDQRIGNRLQPSHPSPLRENPVS